MTTLTRTDCTRDNVKVPCPNVTRLGFGLGSCKRGFWIQYKDSGEIYRVGRAIGRVTCEGRIYIEVAVASEAWSSVFVRWADPKDVIEVRRSPPRTVFEFFASTDGWNPELVFKALEYGVSDLRDQMKEE